MKISTTLAAVVVVLAIGWLADRRELRSAAELQEKWEQKEKALKARKWIPPNVPVRDGFQFDVF